MSTKRNKVSKELTDRSFLMNRQIQKYGICKKKPEQYVCDDDVFILTLFHVTVERVSVVNVGNTVLL